MLVFKTIVLSIICEKNDLIDFCEQALQYVILLESLDHSASLFVDTMRTLLQLMMVDRDVSLLYPRVGDVVSKSKKRKSDFY